MSYITYNRVFIADRKKPWPYEYYSKEALIIELAKRLELKWHAVHRFVFLLQEVYRLDCDYEFELFYHVPVAKMLIITLKWMKKQGIIQNINDRVRLGNNSKEIANCQAPGILKRAEEPIEDLILTYGDMSTEDLNLRTSAIYIARELHAKDYYVTLEKVCQAVLHHRRKMYTEDRIEKVIAELNEMEHLFHSKPLMVGRA